MKPPEEVIACVWDAGTFVSLSERLAETFAKVYYYSPWESEYLDVARCSIGHGLPTVERLDEPLDPDVLPSIDLFIFPDIGFAGVQRHLRSLNKAVWGSFRGTNMELYRSRFIKIIDDAGLPVVHSEVIHGVTALAEHLKKVDNRWIKVNRFRGNMETWHHRDYEHSIAMLDHLASVFGGVKEWITFVVQNPIDGDDESPVMEIGYDGWSVLGQYPDSSFQGYEKKNELYLGSLKKYSELPEEIRYVNERMSPVLEECGYQNFWATELRVKDKVPYFIDPTARMPGQTGEQLLNTCENIPEVIWAGANGILEYPKFISKIAVEATIHCHSDAGEDGWKMVVIPPDAKRAVKLYQYCMDDEGRYHFPPARNDEIGVVCGEGDDVETALNDLKSKFELIKDEPVTIDIAGFEELLCEIEEAQEHGMKFTDEPLPDPATVIENA